VIAHGKAAHTSTGEGVSASFLIAPFLGEMSALSVRFQNDPSFMNDEFEPATNGFNMVITDDGEPNITAAKAECVLTLRVMPEARTEEIIDLITDEAKEHGLEVTMARVTAPLYTDTDSRLVRAACQATGREQSVTVPFGTEGFHYRRLMDLVILGPGDIEVAHTVGESIAVSELERAVDVYAALIDKLCISVG
jgi:acetylornithine deacetylase